MTNLFYRQNSPQPSSVGADYKMIPHLLRTFWVCLLLSLYSLNAIAAEEEPIVSSKMEGSQVAVSATGLSVDDKYNCLLSGNCSPTFTTVSEEGVMVLGINRAIGTCSVTDYTFTVQVKLNYRLLQSGSVSAPIEKYITLTINHHQAADEKTAEDRAIYRIDQACSLSFEVVGITSTLSSNTVPDNIYLQSSIHKTRYYYINDYTSTTSFFTIIDKTADNSLASDELKASWAVIPGAEEYDLEWIYLDDFKAPIITDGQVTGATFFTDTEVRGTFGRNATRVTVKKNAYIIKNLYEHGYIVFRVRGVSYGGADFKQRFTSMWNNCVDQYGYEAWRYISEIDYSDKHSHNPDWKTYWKNSSGHENKLNWQWQATFAEEGKNKMVISYADGSLRSRETVTYTNTDKNTLVAEYVYDHIGRKTVNILPVPTNDPVIKYYRDFNVVFDQSSSGSSYRPMDYRDFDFDANCERQIKPLDKISGASNYYSPENPNKNQLVESRVPDAKEYPFTVTEFWPDARTEPRRQSGVGYDHKLGSGHETFYAESEPSQAELDMMFGAEVGYASHYKKKTVIDPNGQASISYLNLSGKTIATCLAGQAPDNTIALTSNSNPPVNVVDELHKYNYLSADKKQLFVTKNLNLEAAKTVTLNYFLAKADLTGICKPENLCLNCQYDVTVKVMDECGTVVYINTMNAVQPFNTACNSEFNNQFSVSLSLNKGSYLISKILVVNEASVDFYAKQYMTAAEGTCFKSYLQLYNEFMATQTDNCFDDCQGCLNYYGTLAAFTTKQYNIEKWTGITTAESTALTLQIQNRYTKVIADCKKYYCAEEEVPFNCDHEKWMLMQDLMPTQRNAVDAANIKNQPGQYLWYEIDATGVYTFPGWDNLLNTDARPTGIPSTIVVTGLANGENNYRNAGIIYRDANGKADKVLVQGKYYTPQELGPKDFIKNFKPSWAEALLPLHPEYKYYEHCLKRISTNQFDRDLMITNTKTEGDLFRTKYLITKSPITDTYSDFINDFVNKDPAFTNNLGNSIYSSIFSAAKDVLLAKCSTIVMINSTDANIKCVKNILEQSVIAARGINTTNKASIESFLAANSFGSGTDDEDDFEWMMFKTLYLQYRNQIVYDIREEVMKKDKWYHGYLGYNDEHVHSSYFPTSGISSTNATYYNAGSVYLEEYNMRYPPLSVVASPVDVTGDAVDILASAKNKINDLQNTWGDDACKSYAKTWLAQFDQNCKDLYTLTIAQKTELVDSLVSVCKSGISLSHPMGYHKTPYLNGKGGYRSFEQVLNGLMEDFTQTENWKSGACNANMLDGVSPNLSNVLNEDQVEPDECFYNSLSTYYNQYTGCKKTKQAEALEQLMKYMHDNYYDDTKYTLNATNFTNSLYNLVKDNLLPALSGYNGGDAEVLFGDDMNEGQVVGWKLCFYNKTVGSLLPGNTNSTPLCCISIPKATTSDADPTTANSFSMSSVTNFAILGQQMSNDPCRKREGQSYKLIMSYVSNNTTIQATVNISNACGFKLCEDIEGDNDLSAFIADKFFTEKCIKIDTADIRMAWEARCKGLLYGVSVPRAATCSPQCVTCDLLYEAQTAFKQQYPYYSDSTANQTTFLKLTTASAINTYTTFLNNRFNTKFSFAQYEQLYKNCKEEYQHGFTANVPTPNPAPISGFYDKEDFNSYYYGCKNLESTYKTKLMDKLSLCPAVDDIAANIKVVTCEDVKKMKADQYATHNYKIIYESVSNDIKAKYRDYCMKNAQNNETFTATYPIYYHHYTLYYYDDAGNLIKTIPPAGVVLNSTATFLSAVGTCRSATTPCTLTASNAPSHLKATTYYYNTMNGVVKQNTPDGGLSRFYYDRLARLVLSQNAKQWNNNSSTSAAYSYTKFDALGRIKEVGELSQTGAQTSEAAMTTLALSDNTLEGFITANTRTRAQISRTYYDAGAGSAVNYQLGGVGQTNLMHRVSYTTYQAKETSTLPDYATYYSYDIHGNVNKLLREYGPLRILGNPYFKLEYDYDLISGKVNEVTYQRGRADQLQHHYCYDADNRIKDVKTSRDGLIWDNDASYSYYRHGPLARTEMGQLTVQGVDYSYTMHGWLKGINSGSLDPSRDMGKDGYASSTNPHKSYASDEFGFTLGYYQGDYAAIGEPGTAENFEIQSTSLYGMDAKSPSLYNGNIRHMVTAVGKLMSQAGDNKPLASAYKYDQLNRLADVKYYNDYNSTTNAWANNITALNAWQNSFTYDADGNILTQKRKGSGLSGQPLDMDDLTYMYPSGGNNPTNRLTAVLDAVASTNYTDDIDAQCPVNSPNCINYTYDAMGNLISDASEQISNIAWNVSGKISSITRTTTSTKPNLAFEYGTEGNRVMKKVTSPTASYVDFYVHDAQGNVMATYRTTKPLITGMDSSYATLIDRIYTEKGADSFASFMQTKYGSDVNYTNKLAALIPNNTYLQSLTESQIVACVGDQLASHLIGCCDNCRSGGEGHAKELLNYAVAQQANIALQLVNCDPQPIMKLLLDASTLGLVDGLSTGIQHLAYLHFVNSIANPNALSERDYLVTLVPHADLARYLAFAYEADAAVDHAYAMTLMANAVDAAASTPTQLANLLIQGGNLCQWASCIRACGGYSNRLQYVAAPAECQNNPHYGNVLGGLYNTYINAWSPAVNPAGTPAFNTSSLSTIQIATVIACEPQAVLKAALDNNKTNTLAAFTAFVPADCYNYFKLSYPADHYLTPTSYTQYVIDRVPNQQLAAWMVNNMSVSTPLNTYITNNKSILAGLDDCTKHACLQENNIWNNYNHTSQSLKQWIGSVNTWRGYTIAGLATCRPQDFTQKVGATLATQFSETILGQCSLSTWQLGLETYPYGPLTALVTDGNSLLSMVQTCQGAEALEAVLKHEGKNALDIIANSTNGSSIISGAYTAFGFSPGSTYELATQITPRELAAYILSQNYNWINDISAAYSNDDIRRIVLANIKECDFKTCFKNAVLANNSSVSTTALKTYALNAYWPYILEQVYANKKADFTRESAKTYPQLIASTLENWHLPLYFFLEKVQQQWGQTYRQTLDRQEVNVEQYLTLTEHYIYGSSRLGSLRGKDIKTTGALRREVYVIDGTAVLTGQVNSITEVFEYKPFSYEQAYIFERGNRHYEGSNHLGNVLVIYTDRRLDVCDNTNAITQYKAQVLQAQEYYAFGAPLVGRTWTATNTEKYKFGFNGKERVDEINGAGNEYDFGARIYDGRLGRWLSLDPLANSYPSLSPYQFVANCPTFMIDPDGKKIIIFYTEKVNGVTIKKEYNYTPGIKPSVSNDFVQTVHNAMSEVMKNDNSNTLIDLATSNNKWNIVETSNTTTASADYTSPDVKADASGKIVSIEATTVWNPNLGSIVVKPDEKGKMQPTGGAQAPSALLLHEGGHVKSIFAAKTISDLEGLQKILKVGDLDFSSYDIPDDLHVISTIEGPYIANVNRFKQSLFGSTDPSNNGGTAERQEARFNHSGEFYKTEGVNTISPKGGGNIATGLETGNKVQLNGVETHHNDGNTGVNK
jgi:RHS repeat-associated protein